MRPNSIVLGPNQRPSALFSAGAKRAAARRANARRAAARRAGLAVALGLALLGAGASTSAYAAEDPSPAKISFQRAEKAAAERRFAEALSAYREAATVDPSAPEAPVAAARAAALAARSEGDFAPLARLEEMRRSPALLADLGAVTAFEREIEAFPEGRVRSEARLVAAEAWWHRLGDPRRAARLLEASLADPAADLPTRSLSIAELVTIRRDLGEIEEARVVVDRYPDLAPALRVEVLRLARRITLRRASLAALGGLVAVGALSIARATRARPFRDLWRALMSPLSVAFALYLGGAAAILVRLHGGADPRPFLWLGLGVLGVAMIGRAWRLGSTDARPSARALRALACAVGVLAVAFLALERTDAGYLESFGL